MSESGVELKPTSGATLRAKARNYVTNPDTGNTYLLRKPTFAQVIATGYLPTNYLGKVMKERAEAERREEGEAKEIPDIWTDAQLSELEGTQRAYVTAACLSPKIVKEPQTDDECQFEDLPVSDRQFIHMWAIGALASEPTKTGGGEVTAGELANFPVGGRGDECAGAGGDVPLLRGEAIAEAQTA